MSRDKKLTVLVAFGLVYVLWGSTYLSIRYAIQTIPPFLMAGVRFLTAGAILYAWVRLRGAPKPTRRQWRNTAIAGTLLLLLGNGLVTLAEQRVPSGLTALIVATVPLWMVVLDWMTGGARPGRRAWAGIVLGLIGVAVLVQPSGHGGVDPIGALLLVIASIAWSYGSLFGRRAEMPKSPLMTTSMEMLAGGVVLLVAGVLTGEASRFDPAAVSRTSIIGLVYLIFFGAIVGYSAFTYLVTATTPAKLGTYAYVNPCIAVVLGWLIAGEPIGPRTLVAVGIIVGAVVLLTLKPQPKAAAAPAYAARRTA
jgi:drug/metabolite transporter (DMT)-like permease